MPSEIAFVNVAFGDQRYIDQQKNMLASIVKFYPNNPVYLWTDQLPAGSRKFYDSLYGFKPHAVQHARNNGWTKICFLDPACYLMDKLDYYDSFVKEKGVLAVRDDNKLVKFCYKKALDHFGQTRQSIADWHLVGGSFYYFDFEVPVCSVIFDKWMGAEKAGLFGSQYEQASGQMHGHRSDESIMSLALYTSGVLPMTDDAKYNSENCIIAKKHFK
jgi:hypothetical protein